MFIDYVMTMLPTFLAVMSLVLFTPKTRWLCYTVVVLSIIAEVIPLTINATALSACVSVFVALLISEVLRAKSVTSSFITGEKEPFQSH